LTHAENRGVPDGIVAQSKHIPNFSLAPPLIGVLSSLSETA
jgi:hypothetical protein